MRLDNLPKPETFWFEDKGGNKLYVDTSHGMPDFPEAQTWYMHSYTAEVRHSVCTKRKDAKWPIRFLKWLIRHSPNNWKETPSEVYEGSTTIGVLYPPVKYLVENRGWNFSDAIVAASNLCERCMNIAIWEAEEHDLSLEQRYLSSVNTYCNSCKYIDPDYAERHRVWCCYRTFKLGGGDVAKAWKNVSVYSAPGYWNEFMGHGPSFLIRLRDRLLAFFKLNLKGVFNEKI